MKNIITFFLMLSFFAITITSCGDDEVTKTVTESFNVTLNTANEIPSVSNRSETGNIEMTLNDDNTLEFTITVNNLADTDELTAAHVHTGDVVSTGGAAIVLVNGTDISFSGNTASGTIDLTTDQVSTLQGSDIYVNVHSTEVPSGLVRGQVDQTIDNAYNVALSPENEVPSVMGRNESGTAHFRIVGSTMYYKVTVSDLEGSDAISAGHIHEGDATTNGGVLINLEISDNNQLDVSKSISLSTDDLTKVNNDALYVNIHSSDVPSGLLRGQIR